LIRRSIVVPPPAVPLPRSDLLPATYSSYI
jgi:hypothetical protein